MTTTPTTTRTELPGYVAGTWTIDPVHSDVSFTVRHMMVSKVRGVFRDVQGTVVTGEDPLASTVDAEINLASIDTGNADRDAHVRSADFFDVEHHPKMIFRSTAIREGRHGYVLEGDLTLKGNTRKVELDLEVNGFGADAYGGTRAGFSATGQINRRDFGVDIEMPIETGGVVVGDKVQINLEIQAVLTQPTPDQLGSQQ